jgi:hypothetical protein
MRLTLHAIFRGTSFDGWASRPEIVQPACRTFSAGAQWRSDEAGLKFFLESILGQSSSDKNETAVALFIWFPWTLSTAFNNHMDTLDHEALVVVHRDDALHPKDVCSDFPGDFLNPGNEPARIEWAVGGQGDAADLVIVFVVVRFGEKSRFDLEHTVEAEGIAAKHLTEIDAAAFGAMDPGIRIDPTNARFDRGEIIRPHQIGFVKQNNIGEAKLLLRLRGTIDLAKQVLGVHHGHDRIEFGLAAHLFVHKKGLRNRRGIGEPGRFNDDAVHAGAAAHQAAQNSYEIAAHRVHFENFFLRIDDEVIVDTDLAEFIDNDGVALSVRLVEDSVEQRGLSGTKIAVITVTGVWFGAACMGLSFC